MWWRTASPGAADQDVLARTRGGLQPSEVLSPPVRLHLFKVCSLARVPPDENKCSKYKSGDISDSNDNNT